MNSVHQSELTDLTILDFPKFQVGIPLSACRFHPVAPMCFAEFNANENVPVILENAGGRLSGRFLKNEFDGFVAFAKLIVITVADANRLRAVLLN